MVIMQVMFMIWLICALKNNQRKTQIPYRIREHGERVRDEIMKYICDNDRCCDVIHMGPQQFSNLCTILRD